MTKVRYALEDGVAILTMADPATMNAAGLDMAQDLTAAFKQAESEARAVILTGEGRGFCSGANLSGGGPATRDGDGPRDAGAALESTYNPLVTSLRDLPIPFITAVNGAAAGVGCSLALMGDLIVAGESAYFLQAFRRIGLVPDGGSTYLLPRMIGRARAMEMMLLGEKVPAKTALEWGMVNRCVPDSELLATAKKLATGLASGPASVAMIRKIGWASLDNDWKEQLHLERITQRDAGRTEDFVEGVAAFLEKRPAKFKGS
ncbi:MAG: enoyl-CoA hydratase/isomerase [Alphaproteobacteria bacterium]|nr:enoyl-CoA hydratase/isomerase [Alphaproteobacteria bacterium]